MFPACFGELAPLDGMGNPIVPQSGFLGANRFRDRSEPRTVEFNFTPGMFVGTTFGFDADMDGDLNGAGGNAYAGGLAGGLGRLRRMAETEAADGARLIDAPDFANRLAALEIETRAVEMTELRILGALSGGQRPGPESSLLKCRGTDVLQKITELAVEAVGYYACPFERQVLAFGSNEAAIGPDHAASVAGRYFNQRKASIYGGSNEIQRNIMAKLILGM